MTEKYEYKILNYWNDQDDLYVNYVVENLKTNEIANVIDYYNISDIDCDYNMFMIVFVRVNQICVILITLSGKN